MFLIHFRECVPNFKNLTDLNVEAENLFTKNKYKYSLDGVWCHCELDKLCVSDSVVSPILKKKLEVSSNTQLKFILGKTDSNLFSYR